MRRDVQNQLHIVWVTNLGQRLMQQWLHFMGDDFDQTPSAGCEVLAVSGELLLGFVRDNDGGLADGEVVPDGLDAGVGDLAEFVAHEGVEVDEVVDCVDDVAAESVADAFDDGGEVGAWCGELVHPGSCGEA